jgi:hypothetical protein
VQWKAPSTQTAARRANRRRRARKRLVAHGGIDDDVELNLEQSRRSSRSPGRAATSAGTRRASPPRRDFFDDGLAFGALRARSRPPWRRHGERQRNRAPDARARAVTTRRCR